MFIGSPDMMSRNLKHRVEIICPVHERKAKNAIINRILPTFNSLIQPNGMFWNRTASTCRPNIPIRVLVRSRCLLQCERSGGSLEKTDQQQVYEAASRITEDFGHANQVCRLSLAIYDDLSAVHGFGKQTRRLLAAAALLHDIGWSVAASPHHKTGMTFIAEDRTLPFSPRERILAALAVRYHRGLLPKKRHQLYCTLSLSLSLSQRDRRIVCLIAGIIRVADGLDRSHCGVVRSVHTELSAGRLCFSCTGSDRGFHER